MLKLLTVANSVMYTPLTRLSQIWKITEKLAVSRQLLEIVEIIERTITWAMVAYEVSPLSVTGKKPKRIRIV